MSQAFHKIIVRCPNWLGDVVMATPVFQLLKTRFPKAHLCAYGKSASLQLLKENPFIDALLEYDPSQKSKELKKHGFDLGVLLTNSLSSAWQFYQAKIPYRLGYNKDFRGMLLSKALKYEKRSDQHHIDQYQKLLSPLGIDQKEMPKIYLSESEVKTKASWKKQHDIPEEAVVIGVNPMAAFGSSKCWLKERFQEVFDHLTKNGSTHIVVFGQKQDYSAIDEMVQGRKQVLNLAGSTTVRELAVQIHHCDLFLTNDSGPMHIACALNKPVLALFGSTNPTATGPYNQGQYLYHKVACSPCYKRECPIDFRCMKGISVQQVYQQLSNMLKAYEQEQAQKVEA